MKSLSNIWNSPRFLMPILGIFLLLALTLPPQTRPFVCLIAPVVLAWIITASILWVIIVTAIRYANSQNVRISVENRLDELERLKRRDMVTPEEYAAKRQEILKDL